MLTLQGAVPRGKNFKQSLCADIDGFCLRAAVRCATHDRVFDLDLEHCPNCGGEHKIIAAILEQPVIEKILTHLGLQDPTGVHVKSWSTQRRAWMVHACESDLVGVSAGHGRGQRQRAALKLIFSMHVLFR